jgi:hypothetical protein
MKPSELKGILKVQRITFLFQLVLKEHYLKAMDNWITD